MSDHPVSVYRGLDLPIISEQRYRLPSRNLNKLCGRRLAQEDSCRRLSPGIFWSLAAQVSNVDKKDCSKSGTDHLLF